MQDVPSDWGWPMSENGNPAIPEPPPAQKATQKMYVCIMSPSVKRPVVRLTSLVPCPIPITTHWDGRGLLCPGSWSGIPCGMCEARFAKRWYAAIPGKDRDTGHRAVLIVPQATWQVNRRRVPDSGLYGAAIDMARTSSANPKSMCSLVIVEPAQQPPLAKMLDMATAEEWIDMSYGHFLKPMGGDS